MADAGEIVRKEVQKNFPKFGSIRTLVRYDSVSPYDSNSYDPEIGVVSPSIEQSFNAYFIFSTLGSGSFNFEVSQVQDQTVLKNDREALVPGLDMKTTPKVGDIIFVSSELSYRVYALKSDPAKGAYSFWVKPIKDS